MFDNDMYVTITGTKHYYDKKPFDIGTVLKLVKEPDNAYDSEAIGVVMPMLGLVGYIANSPQTVTRGCMSAGRIYDRIPDECVAVVRFITEHVIIAWVMPDKKINMQLQMSLEEQNDFPMKMSLAELFTMFGGLFEENDQ